VSKGEDLFGKICQRDEEIYNGRSRWQVMEKVLIERLPYMKDIPGAKRWEEERGEFVQISYREEIWHLAVFEIRKGFSRGSHYHEAKEEIFYVVSGKMRALFLDMDNLQKEEYILEKGDKIRMKPRCGHIFYGLAGC
jgi:mannose-6-phosphate isomerase-like protein (cupin superfamily)